MATLSIRFKPGRLTGRVAVPGSKSISNRLLVMAYLAGVDYHPDNLSTADDTVLMRTLLDKVAAHRSGRGTATGAGAVRLDCANAGTVLRFLTALLAFEPGEWLLDGSPRMRRRPIGLLVAALQAVGADIRYAAEVGYPPLLIRGLDAAAVREKMWPVDASMSSQYVSALMLAACRVEGGAQLRLTGERTSQPYIRMTAALLRAAGVEVGDTEAAEFKVCGRPSAALPPYVEPDWSSVSYFYGLLALSEGGELFLPGLRQDSCQGDRIVTEWFKAWGVESRFEADGLRLSRPLCCKPAVLTLDFTHQPDLLQTMAVVCAGSGIEARFTGVKNLRYKETDRVAAVVAELNRLQVAAEVQGDDTLVIASGQPEIKPGTVIWTYGDHRMALAFSMLSVLRPITIENPAVVRKSFDTYWMSLASLGAEMDLR
ncbi:MAG: 3-phosphoshikimate 1-carboxyvinyltransferase [Bacteroidales bacterium]|nr:3-phosphoshikimate 1-carboxyvinyltransferase [Bacteroidales bacterium]